MSNKIGVDEASLDEATGDGIDSNLIASLRRLTPWAQELLGRAFELARSFEMLKPDYLRAITAMCKVVGFLDSHDMLDDGQLADAFSVIENDTSEMDSEGPQGNARKTAEDRIIKHVVEWTDMLRVEHVNFADLVSSHQFSNHRSVELAFEHLVEAARASIGTPAIDGAVISLLPRFGPAIVALPISDQRKVNAAIGFRKALRRPMTAIPLTSGLFQPRSPDVVYVSLYLAGPLDIDSTIDALTAMRALFSALGITSSSIDELGVGSRYERWMCKVQGVFRRREVKEGAKQLLRDVYDASTVKSAEAEKLRAEADKLRAEAEKLRAESSILAHAGTLSGHPILAPVSDEKQVLELRRLRAEVAEAEARARSASARASVDQVDAGIAFADRFSRLARAGGSFSLSVEAEGRITLVCVDGIAMMEIEERFLPPRLLDEPSRDAPVSAAADASESPRPESGETGQST